MVGEEESGNKTATNVNADGNLTITISAGIESADVSYKKTEKGEEFSVSLKTKVGWWKKHCLELGWLIVVLLIVLAIIARCLFRFYVIKVGFGVFLLDLFKVFAVHIR